MGTNWPSQRARKLLFRKRRDPPLSERTEEGSSSLRGPEERGRSVRVRKPDRAAGTDQRAVDLLEPLGDRGPGIATRGLDPARAHGVPEVRAGEERLERRAQRAGIARRDRKALRSGREHRPIAGQI